MPYRDVIRMLAVLLASVMLLGLAAEQTNARTRRIYDVVDSPLTPPPGATMQQIGRAIIVAGSKRGWVIRRAGPGRMVGTLHIRTHMAQVDITYDRKDFSITYKNSNNLLYYKEGGTQYIHRNYNSWVRFLAGDIRASVAALP